MRLRPLEDAHDVEFWTRQIRIGAWLASGLTFLGAIRIAVAWAPDLRWVCGPLIAAGVLQTAASLLPWGRLIRRPHVRELLVLWWVLEIPILYAFSLVDDTGRALYLPGVMLVVTTAAVLYPPRWVLALGVLSMAGFLALLRVQLSTGLTFAVGMSSILAAVIGLNALVADGRIKLDDRRRTAERRTELLLANASDAVFAIGVDMTVRYASPATRSLLGHDPGTLAGTEWDRLVHPDDLPQISQWLEALGSAAGGHTSRCEARLRRADGDWVYTDVIGTNSFDDPDLCAAVVSVRDIGPRRALEQELTHRAFSDSLTGLANRALFRDRMAHAAARHQRDGSQLALLLIDLDDFKTINDTLGHSAGDELLITVADRLRAHVRPSDTLARLGGDEFAVLVENLDDIEAGDLAERIISAVREPVHLGDRDVICTMSVGIASAKAGDGPMETEELLRDADLAMYTAKRSGRNQYATFDPAMYEDVLRESRRRSELERALLDDEFFLEYQPIVDLPTGDLTGVEALVRWRHPHDGIVGPDAFIPLAEDTGLIVPLGRWVLRNACRQLADWQSKAPAATLRMSVNLSVRQFEHPDLVDDIAAAVTDAGINPASLILEITESMFLQNTDAVMTALQQIRALGVRVAIDDFGSGYSSLSYLHRFPVDILKIDRSFIPDAGDDDDPALAGAIIRIGQTLHLQTVAEGIETAGQWTALQELGCDFGQGFYFARPSDADDVAAMLTESEVTDADRSR